MRYYNLTGSQDFYGRKEAYTYYNVIGSKVIDGINYLCNHHRLPVIFIYEVTRNTNVYICCYSHRWQNFRTPDGNLHQSFKF